MRDLAAELTRRRGASLYRQRQVVESPQGVHLQLEGSSYLSFCSNDYLGLANHPAVVAALQEGASRYGVGSGSAHLVSGHSQAHHRLEEELAAFVGYERALLFSTGYMANLGVISALMGRTDLVLEDRLNHASLLDGARLSQARLQRYPHNDIAVLARQLAENPQSERMVVTDGVFSMEGDLAPLPTLAACCQEQESWLLVDDAHGLGILGHQGRGTANHYNLDTHQVPILVGTLGKAFGTFGAFVAGSSLLIETLIQQARTYIYTTALPPALAHATRTSLALVKEEEWRRDHLRQLIKLFRAGAEQLGLLLANSITPIQPLLIGSSERALQISHALRDHGILIPAIRPPTVPLNSARLRITFSAAHSEADVCRLLETLEKTL